MRTEPNSGDEPVKSNVDPNNDRSREDEFSTGPQLISVKTKTKLINKNFFVIIYFLTAFAGAGEGAFVGLVGTAAVLAAATVAGSIGTVTSILISSSAPIPL